MDRVNIKPRVVIKQTQIEELLHVATKRYQELPYF